MYVGSTQSEATHKATTPSFPCAMPWAPNHRAWWTAQSAIRCTKFHPHRSEEALVGHEETSIWGM
eukprot:5068013-Alexandrium_andersonii.AAC.2